MTEIIPILIPTHTHYIYLLQEREFIKTKEPIYKIGKTKQVNTKRMNQYPKQSVLLFQIACDNCDRLEKDILKLFKKRYIQKTDIGIEYFEGDWEDMMDTIYEMRKLEKDMEKDMEKDKEKGTIIPYKRKEKREREQRKEEKKRKREEQEEQKEKRKNKLLNWILSNCEEEDDIRKCVELEYIQLLNDMYDIPMTEIETYLRELGYECSRRLLKGFKTKSGSFTFTPFTPFTVI